MPKRAQNPAERPLLVLPRELRDEIYGYLIIPSHGTPFGSQGHPASKLLPSARSRAVQPTPTSAYLDTRIWLPAHPPSNILKTCKQLREEMLSYTARLIDLRAFHIPYQPPVSTDSVCLATTIATTDEEKEIAEAERSDEQMTERARDDGSVRITMEILRHIQFELGSLIPTREKPSPIFMSLLPLLSRLKKIKFVVWSGWTWWYGPQRRRIRTQTAERQRFASSRLHHDEMQTRTHNKKYTVLQELTNKPDALALAIGTLLEHLPLVEEVNIDVLMRPFDYWNLDLPEKRWEFIRGWLDGPAFPPDGRRLRKVYRKLIVPNFQLSDASLPKTVRVVTFYHKLETWDNRAGQDGIETVVRVSEGSGEVRPKTPFSGPLIRFLFTQGQVPLPEEWDEICEDPSFTKIYDRVERSD